MIPVSMTETKVHLVNYRNNCAYNLNYTALDPNLQKTITRTEVCYYPLRDFRIIRKFDKPWCTYHQNSVVTLVYITWHVQTPAAFAWISLKPYDISLGKIAENNQSLILSPLNYWRVFFSMINAQDPALVKPEACWKNYVNYRLTDFHDFLFIKIPSKLYLHQRRT